MDTRGAKHGSLLLRQRLFALTLLGLLSVVALSSCQGNGGGAVRRALPPSPTPAAARSAVGISERDVRQLLLPASLVPSRLRLVGQYTLTNDDIARYFANPAAVRATLLESGQLTGAAIDYALPDAPRLTDSEVAISSSVAVYNSVAAAQASLSAPSLNSVVRSLGVLGEEINLPPLAQQSRAFRGARTGDGPDRVTYLVVMRQENVLQTLLVVLPATPRRGGLENEPLVEHLAKLYLFLTTPSIAALQAR